MDITTATPVEIDTVLAKLSYDLFKLTSRQAQYLKAAADYQAGHRNFNRRPDIEMAEKMEAAAEKLTPQIHELNKEIRPLNAEFARRGGWTRAFLVNNSNGHVHNTQRCSSCFASTEFAWLTEYSDHNEDEIVADAGERACTICYPSAPAEVLNRPTKIFTKDEKAAQERKVELAAKRAAKEAKKVIDPETGEMVRDQHNWEIKTEVAARNAILSVLEDKRHYGRPAGQPNAWGQDLDVVLARLIRSLAAKQGRDEAELLAEYKAKDAKKAARDK
jgi:hypothetical protein